MHRFYTVLVNTLCRSAVRYPWLWFLAVLLLCVPAVWQVSGIGIDTDLIRLLPRTSRASVLTQQLEDVVSDGGYFTVMLESDDRERLLEAVRYAETKIAALDGVESVQYRWPVEFIETYRYLLIPNDYLDRIYEEVIGWETEVNPFVDDLSAGMEEAEETWGDREDREDLKLAMQRYLDLHEYHESDDGRVIGMFIRTYKGVTSLGAVRSLYGELERIAADITDEYGVWSGVSGSHRNKLDEYGLIVSDLNRSGTVAAALIVILLLVSFRSVPVVAVVLYPLCVGLLWAFSLVPATVGDLNLITAFLLVIMFGMGVDYSIHLLKRFQVEISRLGLEEALRETYLSTGSSVVVSALTTALALSILAVSDFRGFSEFGIVGALSIVMMLLSMFISLPAALVAGHRAGLIRHSTGRGFPVLLPRTWLTLLLAGCTVVAAVSLVRNLAFDYNFRNLQFDKGKIAGLKEVKKRQRLVYSASISPGAIYLADDLDAVERLTRALRKAAAEPGSILGRVRSLRDYAPSPRELEERRILLEDIKDVLRGKWTARIEDPERRKLVDDFRRWEVPPRAPEPSELPESMKRAYQSKDGSGKYLVSVHPAADRKNGLNAMAFARELYDLEDPGGVTGPIGETVVFAEIIWIVTGEGLWLTLLTFGGVFLIVLAYRRSLRDTLWILLPLAGGVVLALGALAAAGLKLNFFNVVVIPALIGMGVDGGVHYYRRWRELGGDVPETQRELFDPLSIANWTTMIGYSGMVFANHPGIRSIGIFACVGILFIWLTTLFLLPGMLTLAARERSRPES
jgi:predicted RND superfamily exporter protein